MPDTCGCVDGHGINCAILLKYHFPPPPNRISRYWDNAKSFIHGAFLQVAVFLFAFYCIFLHFNYLKTRAQGRLSYWFYVPEWEVLREDKDGHELGNVEQVYEPVEEHRRAAFYALMDRNYGEGAANRSRSRTSAGTSRGSYAERRGSTEGNTGGDSTLPSDIDGIRAVIQDLLESVDQRDVIQDAEAPGEQPCVLPTIQTPQAGPSRTGASPSSQYSTHPHSPEPFDHDLAIGSETREPPTLPLTLPRKTRPFKTSSHSPGNTVWIPQASYEDLPDLPALIPKDEPGNEKKWAPVQLDNKTQHPTLGDRYLILRSDDTPSWVTLASWNAAKRRVNS